MPPSESTPRTEFLVTVSEVRGNGGTLPAIDLWPDPTTSEIEARRQFHTHIEQHPDHVIHIIPRLFWKTDADRGEKFYAPLATHDPREQHR